MDQQEQGAQDSGESGPHSQQGEQSRSSSNDGDSTWGLGSASALDSLRRQNFRGRRQSTQDEGRPSSD